jgi:hypothetical protein
MINIVRLLCYIVALLVASQYPGFSQPLPNGIKIEIQTVQTLYKLHSVPPHDDSSNVPLLRFHVTMSNLTDESSLKDHGIIYGYKSSCDCDFYLEALDFWGRDVNIERPRAPVYFEQGGKGD